MKVTTPFQITAADSESRTITGQIVQFEKAATASTGKVLFKKGSLIPAQVKLNLEHDASRPIGKTLSMELAPDGKSINATFKISKTTAGTDAIQEAMDGLRDGFSVEAMVNEYTHAKDGTMVVSSADLVGVALTHNPAFGDATRVTDVAATTAPEDSEKISEDIQTPTEGDAVENTTVQEEAPAAETVEASAPIITAAATTRPLYFTEPRNPIKTKEDYLWHSIQATRGNDDSKIFIAATNNSTGDNPGLIPTRQLTEVINGLADNVRASIDSISTGALPDAGMTFQIPKITVLPDVAETAENASTPNVNMESEYVDVDVVKFSGSQIMSVELQDRSQPVFVTELLRNLESQYARATNAYNSGEILAGATATASGFGTNITAAELLEWVANGAVSVYSNTFRFADAIVVSPDMWGKVMSFNVDGRPIYNALQPSNAAGNAQPRSLRGSINGLDLWVDTALTGTGDDSMYVINRDAYTWYESPRLRLTSNLIDNGRIQVMLYGYGATATKIGAGAYKFKE